MPSRCNACASSAALPSTLASLRRAICCQVTDQVEEEFTHIGQKGVSDKDEESAIFDMIDTDKGGSISKDE